MEKLEFMVVDFIGELITTEREKKCIVVVVDLILIVVKFDPCKRTNVWMK